MKRSIYVISLFLVAILMIGGTYAFFTTVAQRNNAVNIVSHQLKVKYSGNVQISGQIELVKNKEQGFRREINIGLETNSLPAVANFFINVDNITEGFQNKALKWEIYEILNGEEQYINDGNFEHITSNSVQYIAEGLTLSSTSIRTFAVYLWLDGEEAGREVIGAQLTGYIGADTETISGEVSK